MPLINGLNVARRSIGNQILVDAVSNSIERVKEGKPLGPSLAECRTLFSGSILEMISVAEESGRLDQELVRIANVTEGDLDRQLKTAVAMAEPLMLFFIAGFIGTIFIGMVIPIFTHAGLYQVSNPIRSESYEAHTRFQIRNPKSKTRKKAEAEVRGTRARVSPSSNCCWSCHPGHSGRHRRAQVLRTHRAGARHGGPYADRHLWHGAGRLRSGQWLLTPKSLQDLVKQPRDAQNWRGPYLQGDIPPDPWHNAYIYVCPGKHNASGFDLISIGPDLREGGDDDITNWQQPAKQ